MVEINEKVLYEGKPSNRLFWSWSIKALLVLIVLFLIFGANGIAVSVKTNMYSTIAFAFLGYLVVFAILFAYLFFLLKTYKYKITDKGIYYSGGLLTKREKFVPFFKVTNVDVLQPFIDQMLGIKRLGFQTAGAGQSNIPEITYPGLIDVDKPKQIVLKYIEKNGK
jgi:membrane protein YdbS with pleckstrin-like domain